MNIEEKLNAAVGQFQAIQQREAEVRGQLEDLTQQRLQAFGKVQALDELFREEFAEKAASEAATEVESADE